MGTVALNRYMKVKIAGVLDKDSECVPNRIYQDFFLEMKALSNAKETSFLNHDFASNWDCVLTNLQQ